MWCKSLRIEKYISFRMKWFFWPPFLAFYWAACAPSHKMGFRSSVSKSGLPGEGRHEGLVPRNDVLTNGFIWLSLARTLARILFVPRLRSPWKTHKALRTWRRLFALFEAIRSGRLAGLTRLDLIGSCKCSVAVVAANQRSLFQRSLVTHCN